MGDEAGIAGVVALGAGDGAVVVIVVFGAGTPTEDHHTLGGVAGDALDGCCDAGEAGVGAGETELVGGVVEVVVGTDAETGGA